MTTTNTSVTVQSEQLVGQTSWTTDGASGIVLIDPNKFTVFKVNEVLQSETKISSSSSAYHQKKSVLISWKPKKFLWLRRPVAPRFNPPSFRKPWKYPRPPRAPNLSKLNLKLASAANSKVYNTKLRSKIDEIQKKFRKIVVEYERRCKTIEIRNLLIAKLDVERRAQYVIQYRVRLAKHAARKKIFDSITNRLSKGRMVVKRVRNARPSLPMNGFTRTRSTPVNLKGWWRQYRMCRVTYRWPDGRIRSIQPGPYSEVYTQTYVKGYLTPNANLVVPATFNSAKIQVAAESQAISKLYQKLANQELHIGNIVAERAQTFSMLKNAVVTLAKMVTLKSFLNKKISTSKYIAGGFLAYAFGVRPLVNDVYSAAVALAKLTSQHKSDRVVVNTNSSQSDTAMSEGKIPGEDCRWNIETTCKVKVSYHLEYRVDCGPAVGLQQLGLINPVEIAWEMMPWSFVIDWFLPVGNYISSESASAGLVFVTGTKTVTVTTESKSHQYWLDIRSFGSDQSYRYAGQVGGTQKSEVKTRTVLTAPPVNRLPRFKNPLSGWHIAEAIALIVQRIK